MSIFYRYLVSAPPIITVAPPLSVLKPLRYRCELKPSTKFEFRVLDNVTFDVYTYFLLLFHYVSSPSPSWRRLRRLICYQLFSSYENIEDFFSVSFFLFHSTHVT